MFYVTQPTDEIISRNTNDMSGNLKEKVVKRFPEQIELKAKERLVLFGHGNDSLIGLGAKNVDGWTLACFLWDYGLRGEHDILLVSCNTGTKNASGGVAYELAKELGFRGLHGNVIAPAGYVVNSARDFLLGLPQVVNSIDLKNAIATRDEDVVRDVLSSPILSFPKPPRDAWKNYRISKEKSIKSYGGYLVNVWD